ncbi:MAG: hypothetical protein VB125_05405 [Burkholderia sp.]
MLVRSPSVLPEIEDMGITSPLRSFMQQRLSAPRTRSHDRPRVPPPWRRARQRGDGGQRGQQQRGRCHRDGATGTWRMRATMARQRR